MTVLFVSCCSQNIDLDKDLRLRVADDHVNVCVISCFCLLYTCVQTRICTCVCLREYGVCVYVCVRVCVRVCVHVRAT